MSGPTGLVKMINKCQLQVVAPINTLLDTVPFTCTAYSLDWHPADHVSFIDNVHLRRLCPDSREPQLYGTVTFQAGQLSVQCSGLTDIFLCLVLSSVRGGEVSTDC